MPHDYFTSLHGQLLHVPLVPSQIPFARNRYIYDMVRTFKKYILRIITIMRTVASR